MSRPGSLEERQRISFGEFYLLHRGEPRVRAIFERWLGWSRSHAVPGGCLFGSAGVGGSLAVAVHLGLQIAVVGRREATAKILASAAIDAVDAESERDDGDEREAGCRLRTSRVAAALLGLALEAFERDESSRLLAHNLDFWIPYVREFVHEQFQRLPRFPLKRRLEPAQRRQMKRLKKDIPPGVTVDTPPVGAIRGLGGMKPGRRRVRSWISRMSGGS